MAAKPPVLPQNYEPHYFGTRDGLKLYYKQYLPDSVIAGVVLLAPGIGGIRPNDYDELGHYLSREGYMVLVLHERGTGYSEGERGDIKDYQLVLEDFEAFFESTRSAYPGKPLFLLGHSLGGVTAIQLAGDLDDKIDGVILINPAYKYSAKAGPTFWTYISYGFNSLFRPRALTVDMSREPNETLHPEDRKEFIERKNDPLIVKKFSMRYMMSVRKVMNAAKKKNSARVDKPLLLIYGGKDTVIDHQGSEEIYSVWKSRNKKKIILSEAGHGMHAVIMSKDVIAAWLKETGNTIR